MQTLFLQIDRLKITGLALNKEQYSHARNNLPELAAMQNDLHLGDAHLVYSQKGYIQGTTLYAGKVKGKKPQAIARIAVGSTKAKHLYFSWEIYPHAIAANLASFKAFNEAIDTLLPDPIFFYQTAYTHGKVQYLEIAKDYLTVEPGSFLPHAAYVKSATSNLVKETTHYIGTQFITYNKLRQLKEVKNESSGWQKIARIEAKARKTGLQPCQLHTLPNPFKALEIADIAQLKAVSESPDWQAFLDHALSNGVGAIRALHALSESKRKKFRALMRDCGCSWWKPNVVWESWERALKAIDPQHLLIQ